MLCEGARQAVSYCGRGRSRPGLSLRCFFFLPEHPGAVQRVLQAHHGADPPRHREGLPPSLLHLCDVPPQPGWDPVHRGRRWPHPLHRGLPQVGSPLSHPSLPVPESLLTAWHLGHKIFSLRAMGWQDLMGP